MIWSSAAGSTGQAVPGDAELFAALVDPATGLCASDSRFGEAHVVERVAAISAGRLTHRGDRRRVGAVPGVRAGGATGARAWNGADPPNGPPSSTARSRIDSSPASTRWPPHLAHRSTSVSSTGRSPPNPNGWVPIRPTRCASCAVRVAHSARSSRRPGTARPPRCTPPSSAQLDAGRHVVVVGTDPSGGRRAARRRSRRADHRPLPRRRSRTSRYQPTPP